LSIIHVYELLAFFVGQQFPGFGYGYFPFFAALGHHALQHFLQPVHALHAAGAHDLHVGCGYAYFDFYLAAV
jgi:hypothetical protein